MQQNDEPYDSDLQDIHDDNDLPSFGVSENNVGFMDEDLIDESLYYEEKNFFRAKTAPPRPLTEIEEFRKSKTFHIMEQAVVSSTHLVQTFNNRIDIETAEGQMACKSLLKFLEKLHDCFKTKIASRKYRENFSKAYRILYKEANSINYLTEILDSAQEAVPCLYVNGKRFEFSINVLEAGHKLFQSFIEIQHLTRKNYIRATYENNPNTVNYITNEMTKALEIFDTNWACYEKLYVKELMNIEAEARKYITDAIEIEKRIFELEMVEKQRGRILLDSEEFDKLRTLLANLIATINSVANTEGKGRDDLGVEVLIAAEGVLRKISPSQSKSVRKLAENIRSSFMNLRLQFRKYSDNIEIVDPQLKNNQDLVHTLLNYEKYWERGKHYFLNGKLCSQLIHFSSVLEGLCEKYPFFNEKIEYRDTDIFVMIPMIMILKSCEGDDRKICEFFLPEITNKQSKLGIMYEDVKAVLYVSNDNFKMLQDNDMSLNKSIRLGNRINSLERSPNLCKYMSEKKANNGRREIGGNNNNGVYKTQLKNKVTTCAQPLRKLNYSFYNQLEKQVLNVELTDKEISNYGGEREKIDAVIHKIKILSIELERADPVEWNTFQDVAQEN